MRFMTKHNHKTHLEHHACLHAALAAGPQRLKQRPAELTQRAGARALVAGAPAKPSLPEVKRPNRCSNDSRDVLVTGTGFTQALATWAES
jgi:hypothetical protein